MKGYYFKVLEFVKIQFRSDRFDFKYVKYSRWTRVKNIEIDASAGEKNYVQTACFLVIMFLNIYCHLSNSNNVNACCWTRLEK